MLNKRENEISDANSTQFLVDDTLTDDWYTIFLFTGRISNIYYKFITLSNSQLITLLFFVFSVTHFYFRFHQSEVYSYLNYKMVDNNS